MEPQKERYYQLNGQGPKIPLPPNSGPIRIPSAVNVNGWVETTTYTDYEYKWKYDEGGNADTWYKILTFGLKRVSKRYVRRKKWEEVVTYDKDGNIISIETTDPVYGDWEYTGEWMESRGYGHPDKPSRIFIAPGTPIVSVTIPLDKRTTSTKDESSPEENPYAKSQQAAIAQDSALPAESKAQNQGTERLSDDLITVRYFGGSQDSDLTTIGDERAYLAKGISTIAQERMSVSVGQMISYDDLKDLTPYTGYNQGSNWKYGRIESITFADKTYGHKDVSADGATYRVTYGTWIMKIRPYEE